MSDLRLETLQMPAADLGPENPLPPIAAGRDLHAIDATPDIPQEMLRNMAYGHLPNVMPYTMQDGYSRTLTPRPFKAAILENDILKATFVLELGGRLWSLFHKPSGRELLARNPVFQPANLALRNAWFSGGVEWNIGTIGHSPFTCAPLFAAKVDGPDGMPILRMYEFERMRATPFQIDAYLPEHSAVLFVRVSIHNPNTHEVPMYWWSNIAVPETNRTRVVVPASKAFRFGYKGSGLMLIDTPDAEADYTYSANIDHSADYFFDIPSHQRPYISALDEGGTGLIQTSTARLQGRKLFLWGTGAGGGQWQSFLSPSEEGCDYIEIQAGLARTQMEHLPMPAQTTWSWLEAYGMAQADPAVVHGDDWTATHSAVTQSLNTLIPDDVLQAEYARSESFAAQPPAELWQRGSGWGALERLRREQMDEPPLAPDGMVFDEASLSAEQAPWLHLLRGGVFSAEMPSHAPRNFMVQPQWRALLDSAVGHPHSDHWAAWYHLGLMHHYAGECEAACAAWERSVQLTPTAWSYRSMAIVAQKSGRLDDASALLTKAVTLAPDSLPLLIEYGRVLIAADQSATWLAHVDTLPDSLRQVGRVRLLEAQAALACDDFERVETFFQDEIIVPDIREGEVSLSDLWFDYHANRLAAEEGGAITAELQSHVRQRFPLPTNLDFRMTRETE